MPFSAIIPSLFGKVLYFLRDPVYSIQYNKIANKQAYVKPYFRLITLTGTGLKVSKLKIENEIVVEKSQPMKGKYGQVSNAFPEVFWKHDTKRLFPLINLDLQIGK